MRKKIIFPLLIICVLLSACKDTLYNESEWGSFTPNKTYSYDKKYYAIQKVIAGNSAEQIQVNVYLTETKDKIFSFIPARAMDFWGICWETSTYNIWIQSGDIGTYCYKYNDDEWILDESAIRPADIISKYD